MSVSSFPYNVPGTVYTGIRGISRAPCDRSSIQENDYEHARIPRPPTLSCRHLPPRQQRPFLLPVAAMRPHRRLHPTTVTCRPTTGAASVPPIGGATVAATAGMSATTAATSAPAMTTASATTGNGADYVRLTSMSDERKRSDRHRAASRSPPPHSQRRPRLQRANCASPSASISPQSRTPLKDSHLSPYGMLETLMRQNEQNKLEPWLAQSLTSVNPTTWRLVLRDAKFWDGSPVTVHRCGECLQEELGRMG